MVHSLSVEREVHNHHGSDVARLHFVMVLWRMPMYYIFNLIVPTVIITIISYLGLFSLTSSSGERGEKVSLGMGTILALAVVMLMVQDTMPNTSLTNPMISWYFLLLIILIALALLSTVFIVQVHNYGETGKPIPKWIKWITRVSDSEPKDKIEQLPIKTMNSDLGTGQRREKTPVKQKDGDLNQETLLEIARSMRDMRNTMRKLVESQEEEPEDSGEHHQVAARLEMIGFLFFTFATLLVTTVYLVMGYNSR